MTEHSTDRRTVLLTGGAAAAAAAAGRGVAQSTDIRGSIEFRGGAAIPSGRVEIYLEDSAARDASGRRVASVSIESDGSVKALPFVLVGPEGATTSPMLRIVARLERSDGWLLARGSAQVQPGAPVSVMLDTVVY